LIAVPWNAVADVVSRLELADTVVLDATNPLPAQASELQADSTVSGAQLVSLWASGARVVKAFNVTGSGNLLNPDYASQRPMMPIAGDDTEAKAIAMDLAAAIGFDPVDAGPLNAARDLEHVAMMWIRLAYALGNGPNIAFALLRR
jgi:predicted dinucleotide-binding enzyme